jgi:D-methionine transport system ATP-binding protein
MGMVFQHFNLLNSRTVFANVAFPLEIMHKSKHEIKNTVLPLLELVGLSERARAYPGQLSGGQKQRVAIARALATKPMLLLCDEMTSALDPETTQSILELVKSINTQMNLTILLITHEMNVIKKICDKVAVIDAGQIVEQGKVLPIFREPKHSVTRALTQAAFHLELPELLAAKVREQATEGCYSLLRISFVGQAAGQPLIANLVRNYNLQINILQADLEMVQAQPIGIMLVAAMGTPEEINQGVSHLKNSGLSVEEMGYVARDDWNFG